MNPAIQLDMDLIAMQVCTQEQVLERIDFLDFLVYSPSLNNAE